jgi:23S rRNA (uracil1939-C5)-methyltransferase
MEKGSIITIAIDDMTVQGQGVGRAEDGRTVFVRGAVPGDIVTCKVNKLKKRYAFANLLDIDIPSADRQEPFCMYDGDCGGCMYGTLSYEAQLRLKEKHVQDALVRLGGVESPVLRPIIAMEQPFRYRNKATMPVSTGGIITLKGGIVEAIGDPAVGFYQSRSHQVVDCLDCALQAEPAMAAARALRRFIEEDHITAYDPKWDKGLLRHMVVRTAFGTGEVMVILVINGMGIPGAAKLIALMDEEISMIPWPEEAEATEFPDEPPYSLESVVINIQKGHTSSGSIYGDKTEVLAGKPVIREQLGSMEFEISPLSFFQVNPEQMVALYDKATEYAALSGGETILDLYCGAGTIGLWMLDELRQRDPEAFARTRVLGIETVKSAVLDANRNAVLNRIVNARYVEGKVEHVLPVLMGEVTEEELENCDAATRRLLEDESLRVEHADVVILDPPRAGCDERLLAAVVKTAPDRIVYVSCDPATLARDVKFLSGNGYQLVEATPAEMFPWTGHVESCVLLERVSSRKADSYVKLNVKMADYYRIKDSAETENAEE